MTHYDCFERIEQCDNDSNRGILNLSYTLIAQCETSFWFVSFSVCVSLCNALYVENTHIAVVVRSILPIIFDYFANPLTTFSFEFCNESNIFSMKIFPCCCINLLVLSPIGSTLAAPFLVEVILFPHLAIDRTKAANNSSPLNPVESEKKIRFSETWK